jgi:hypothetical protein
MPVEIKELLIKAAIGSNKSESDTGPTGQEDLIKLKKEIISEVTDIVMRMLEQKNER